MIEGAAEGRELSVGTEDLREIREVVEDLADTRPGMIAGFHLMAVVGFTPHLVVGMDCFVEVDSERYRVFIAR
jgi:hypothetical protein